MAEVTLRHDYYGVPDWLMKEYLTELGAAATSAANVLEAEGWRAVVTKAAPRRVGSLTVGGAAVEFSGDPAVLEALFAKLHRKTLRGGG